MGKFSKWAGRKTPLIESPQQPAVVVQPTHGVVVPMSYGQPLVHYAPGFRPPVTLYPSTPYLGTVPETNLLVRGDAMHGSSYENMLATLPERAPAAEIDAAALPGLPDGAQPSEWNDRTRYRNGATDGSGKPKFLDYVRGKYRATAAQFRTTAGMSVGPR